jgi:hypothetical protein
MKTYKNFILPLPLLIILPLSGPGGAMKDLFMKLPSSCTPALNAAGKQALIDAGEFTIHDNDRGTDDYTLDTVEDNYMEYEYSYVSKEGGDVSFELKKLKKADGSSILLFAQSAGVNDKSAKPILKVYNIKDEGVSENKENLLPDNLNKEAFLQSNTPEDVKSNILKTSLCSYDLGSDSGDKITFKLTVALEQDKKWLAGDVMTLSWDGTKFSPALSFEKEQ